MTNLTFESGKTYIIDEPVILTEDLFLPENITLIFQGGMFKSEFDVRVIGNNTALIAPIAPIFGINVSVSGSWLIDRAYPQWFEATTFKFTTHCSADTNIPYTRYPEDMADSIQKAINMKSSGCVYLIGGDYYITKPIFIPWGISLEGPCAQEYATSTVGRPLAASIYPAVKDLATEHFSCNQDGTLDGRDKKNLFHSDYLIYINSTEDKKEVEGNTYSNPFIAIKGITFINYPLIHPSSRCVFASSGVQLDYVNWFQFIQAIDYNPNAYIDYKSITHCSFKGNLPQGETGILPLPDSNNTGEAIYAFDLHGLGDAVVFTNNEIGTFCPHQKMLRLHQCAGASVDANVINGDVTIIASKAVSYTNNHMENGAQILIDTSIVSMQSNFIEKGSRVSLLIRCLKENDINKYEEYGQTIVSIRDTQFVYYDTDRYTSEAPEKGSTVKDESKYQAKENRLRSINEADILIDSSSILNIESTYRYNLNNTGIGTTNPFGIKIDTYGDWNLSFNDYSYFASQKSAISRNGGLQASATYLNLHSPEVYAPSISNHIDWFGNSGVYRYYYAIIWDKPRSIYRHKNSKILNRLYPDINLTRYGKGMQAVAGIPIPFKNTNIGTGGFNFMIELVRCRLDSNQNPIADSYEHVYFPLAGGCIIPDNGISVGGYKWLPGALPGLDTELDIPKYDSFSFNGDHVIAGAYSRPTTLSGWIKGDIVTNVGTENDWEITIIK